MSDAPCNPPRLRVTSGPLRGATFPLIDGLVIGRSPNVDILLLAPGVRARHAQIVETSAGGFTLTSLDEGAEVRGNAGSLRRVLLSPGVTFELAGSRFEVVAARPARPQCEYLSLRGEVPSARTLTPSRRHLRLAA